MSHLAHSEFGKLKSVFIKKASAAFMNTEHIQACLDNVPSMHTAYKESFKEELKLRSI